MEIIKVFLQSQTIKDFARKCLLGAEKVVTMLLAFVGYVIVFFFYNCINKLFENSISPETSTACGDFGIYLLCIKILFKNWKRCRK